MGRIVLAFRVFFGILFGQLAGAKVERLLEAPKDDATAEPSLADARGKPKQSEPKATQPSSSDRSEAITLLASLQREARFVDLVQEPLSEYSDDQIGAAARDVLRDCGKLLERAFQLRPVLNQDENTEAETPAKFDAGRFKLTGSVSGDPPFRGRLVHHGWEATKCELPKWSGGRDSVHVVAPAELELS